MQRIETVIIRDWRFRRQVEKTACGAGRMQIEDNGRDDMRICFYPERRTEISFLGEVV